MAKSDLIYVQDFYADSASVVLNICFNSDSASHVHSLAIKNGSTTLFTINNITSTSTGNVEMALTLSSANRTTLLNAMSSVMEMTLTCELSTDSLGTSSVTTIAKIDENTSAPTAGTIAAPIETNALVTAIGLPSGSFVRGQSNVTVAVSGFSANNGATIRTFTIEVDGIVKQATNGTVSIGVLNKAGVLDGKYKLTDSRGLTIEGGVMWTAQGFSYSVLNYNLAITNYSIARGTDNNIAITLQGACSNNYYGTNNIQYIVVHYRTYGTSAWDSGTPIYGFTTGTNTFSYSGNAIQLSASNAYDVKVVVYDRLSSYEVVGSVGVANPLIGFREDKILTGKSIIPTDDVTHNLGSTDNRFYQGYIYNMTSEAVNANTLHATTIYENNKRVALQEDLNPQVAMEENFGGATLQRCIANNDGTYTLLIVKEFDAQTSYTSGSICWVDVGSITEYLGSDGNSLEFASIFNVSVSASYEIGNGNAYIGAIYNEPTDDKVIPNIYISRGTNTRVKGKVYIQIIGW